ncbi:MAG: FHA domain-containing protein [Eubacteriales bacterium]|nr:FHA domain-containing protein [Lachnospiraceae bacterium]MDO5127327.1 FHA domain-containing protein [Eubacteriales bacterium]
MKKTMDRVTVRKAHRGVAFIISFIFMFLCFGSTPMGVHAEDAQEAPHYDAASSVVQVIYYYYDEQNNLNHIIQSGSGVLLDDMTVLTTRYTTTLTDESKTAAGEYLSGLLGRSISFYPTEDKEVEEATAQLAVVVEADIYSNAVVSFQSADWDVAVLSLSIPTNKQPAMLGDSDLVKKGDSLVTIGFPNMSCTEPKSFSSAELCQYEGVCDRWENGVIKHTANYHMGCVGGAIADKYGRVVAIITYVPGEENVYSALPVNQIKVYLERDSVSYRDDLNDYDYVEPIATDTDAALDPEHVVVKSDLTRVVYEAELILNEGNDDKYTEESYRALQVQYNEAKQVEGDIMASQVEVDEETKLLRDAIDSLEKVKKQNKTLFIIILVSGGLFLIFITAVIVILIGKHARKKEAKKDAERIRTIDGNGVRSAGREVAAGINNSGTLASRNVGLPSAQLYEQFDAKNRNNNNRAETTVSMEPGTTILQMDEGTTVLSSYVQAPINAYLYRASTGESIAISSEIFRMGKGMEGVEYRIDGNTNVSRMHAMITRSQDDYYIEDLGSTNYTFVNGIKLVPNRKQLLTTNDEIYMADEKFVFMKNS